ncbi:hypothetical protein VSU19_08940 [Verrucomicrobiales bacterium BCK34]|nr:hypothetical protein [Verrucomicrobiales bacterium BCK34]
MSRITPMIYFRTLLSVSFFLVVSGFAQETPTFFGPGGESEDREVPAALRPWIDWSLEGTPAADTPRVYSDGEGRLPLWSSRLEFEATSAGADFSMTVEAFREDWLILPGGGRQWPDEVMIGEEPVPVVAREGSPAIRLAKGKSEVSGSFVWSELPQQIKLPPSVGLLSLKVEGEERPVPSWDADGTLWLQREASTEEVDEDFMSIKVHSLLEDGIPLWFETRIELIVAGKSREEALGSVLPQGWQLATIESPIPVAIDEKGFLKAQLRAGRWSILLRAFQTSEAKEVSFAADASPAVEDQALAYRAQPEFRQAEVMGLPQIDVAQTQVPEAWRSLPVYRWETSSPFQVVERIRGPGERGAAPLTIQRSLWLDDDGKKLTYQDRLSGELRRIRRLDAADAHQLGSVSVGGEPQLITHNPEGGAPGFEVRVPHLDAVATGRIEMQKSLSATGWKSDAGNLKATLQLSPGYRLFALFGADYTKGDWLTSWTLLDLFLLLLFTLAVFRLRGFRGALLALLAFGLAYHEPGAPRFPWLLLLIPVALIEVVPANRWRKWVVFMKWGAAAILLISLAPFLMYQIQGAIFPQLERKAAYSVASGGLDYAGSVMNEVRASSSMMSRTDRSNASSGKKQEIYSLKKANLKADPKAVIQTGPGVPMWSWRTIEFGFDGPVSESQQVRPILIPPLASRGIGIVRVLALVLLAVLLFCRRRKKTGEPENSVADSMPSKGAAAAMLVAGGILFAGTHDASAQFPEAELLEQLRTRLTETPPEFPGAVEIANVKMTLDGASVSLAIEFHAAARAAAPVPLPLAAMEPASAVFESGDAATLLREDGRLWVLLPDSGIHRLTVKGVLRARDDWEWGFELKPHHIEVEAPGWTVSGIRPDRSAEDQVLFARAREAGANSSAANYDHPRTNHAILVERQIELGLVWRVTTTVSRLSPKGRAVALQVPLLSGEKVVSAGRSVKNGAIEVRLAPSVDSISWEGELSPTEEFTLTTPEEATWTERWRLIASSVWNVSFGGLTPVFEDFDEQLVPLWQPWPGEKASVTVSRPKAVEGAAVTIDSAKHTLTPGRRQRSSTLELSVRTSLGEDFPIQLPAGSEVSSLLHDGKAIPIRKEGDAVVVPLRPGSQAIKVEWRAAGDLTGWTRADAVVLPVESANVTTIVRPSRDRWLILTEGPLRGPAVRFWAVLVFSLIAAVVLSRVPRSPLGVLTWGLLMLGLTQIPVVCSLMIIAWLFLALWPDEKVWKKLSPWQHNIVQIGLIGLTLLVIGFFVRIASVGLLGNPEMYVAGNGSSATYLNWFSARTGSVLPQPGYWSISIWWFRLAMLLWALWLAYSLVRWLRDGWKNSAKRGHFKSAPKKVKASPAPSGSETGPPELPKGKSS